MLLMEDPAVPFRDSPILQPGPGVDDVAWISPSDLPGALEVIERWRHEYEVIGVMALRDAWVESSAIAADVLNVASPGLRAARVCRNKHLQRIYLSDWAPSYSVFRSGDNTEAIWEKFPAVLKPLDRWGSSGVCRVNSHRDLQREAASFPRGEYLLVEQLIHGREFSVETLVQNGEILFSGATAKTTSESGGKSFVELVHTVPGWEEGDREWERVQEVNSTVLARLDFRDGIAHAEYRIGGDGIYLMEVNARCPGDGIVSLYGLATGEPLEKPLVDIALAEPTSYHPIRRHARQVYVEHEPGVLRDVIVDASTNINVSWLFENGSVPALQPGFGEPARLCEVTVINRRNSVLPEIRASFDRAVYFIVDAPDLAGVSDAARLARDQVKVITESDSKAWDSTSSS